MADISRRARELGTENAFVVLAEVNKLIRQGRDIISFCIGQPDFHTPVNIQDAAVKAIRDGKHGYTPSAGILELRQAVARNMSQSRGIDVQPDDVVVGAGAKPFIGYTILSVTDHGAGDEVIYPESRLSHLRVADQGHGGGAGAHPSARGAQLQLRSAGAGRQDHAQDQAADPQLAAQPHRRHHSAARTCRRSPRSCASTSRCGCSRTRSTVGWCTTASSSPSRRFPGMQERTIISDGASKTWAMTGWRLGFAANRKLAPYFTNWVTNTESCASQISQWAGVEALNGPQDDAVRMRDIFHERRDLIVRAAQSGAGRDAASTPGGAFYVWPNVTEACAHDRRSATPRSCVPDC